MALATYGDAKGYVQAALNRDDADTVSQLDTFFRYAHDEIVRGLRLPLTRKVTDFPITGERVSVPADYIALESLTHTARWLPAIRVVGVAERALLGERYPQGCPRVVANEGGVLAFAPVPDATYDATLIYMASPDFMVDDADANGVFQRTPWLYIHGALAAGFRFTRFTDQATEAETMFRGMLADMQRQGIKDAMSGRLAPMASPGFAP